MNNLLKTILAISCAFTSYVHAALITDYTLNEATNIVTDTRNNLEWLQWDVTDGLSIAEALNIYEDDGWVLASNAQMANLFNTFFGFDYSGIVWDADETTRQTVNTPFDGSVEPADDPELIFVMLFGNTYTEYRFSDPSNPLVQSHGYFGEDSNGNGRINTARVRDDYSTRFGDDSEGELRIVGELVGRNSSNDARGVALVRTAVVSEPSAILLLMVTSIFTFTTRQRISIA